MDFKFKLKNLNVKIGDEIAVGVEELELEQTGLDLKEYAELLTTLPAIIQSIIEPDAEIHFNFPNHDDEDFECFDDEEEYDCDQDVTIPFPDWAEMGIVNVLNYDTITRTPAIRNKETGEVVYLDMNKLTTSLDTFYSSGTDEFENFLFENADSLPNDTYYVILDAIENKMTVEV